MCSVTVGKLCAAKLLVHVEQALYHFFHIGTVIDQRGGHLRGDVSIPNQAVDCLGCSILIIGDFNPNLIQRE